MIYAGVDPGATGALALIQGDRITVYDVPLLAKPYGGTVIDDHAWQAHMRWVASLVDVRLYFEMTWGKKNQGGASQYKFGDTAAAMRAGVIAAGLDPIMVSSQRWTSALRVGSDKDFHVAKIRELYPEYAALFTPRRGKLTLEQCKGRADAALIAHYGKTLRRC